LTVLTLLLISSAYGVYRYLATPGALLTSAYGLTFVVKMLMLGPLLFTAWTNYRVIQRAFPARSRRRAGKGRCG